MTESERKANQEVIQASLEAKFEQLSQIEPENLHPIEPFTKEELGVIRQRLIESGYDFNGLSQEGKEALKQNMFREKVFLDDDGNVAFVLVYDYEKPKRERWVPFEEFDPDRFSDFVNEDDPKEGDKSMGIYEILGRERFKALVKRCYKIAIEHDYTETVAGHKATEGRGLQQTAADILKTVAYKPSDESAGDLSRRLNNRVLQGARYQWVNVEEKLNTVNHNFEEIGEPHMYLKGIPLGSLSVLWQDMITELAAQ